jgi:hypothetical protein
MAFSHTPARADHGIFPAMATLGHTNAKGLAPLVLTFLVSMLPSFGVHAQATLPTDTASNARPQPKSEFISHEDAGSRVDEWRVGGQTRQIEVTTKSGLPAYQITPTDGTQGPASPAGQRSGLAGSPGRSTWRMFDF